MAFTNFLKSMAPTSGGRGAVSKPAVGVGDNGRILLTRAASESFTGCVYVALAYDSDTRTVQVTGLKALPKGVKETDLSKINWPSKGVAVAGFAAAGFLGWSEVAYNYKAAGNQSFDAHMVNGKAQLTFTLPEETPTPKAKTPRKKRSVAATPIAPPQAPATEGEFKTA